MGASPQVFAAQLQLVRTQISRAKMRAETISRRVPIPSEGSTRALTANGHERLNRGDGSGSSLPDLLAEIKVNAARPRVRSFREALDQVRACEALGVAV